ncbi:MAG: amidohydrolase family protein [Verrucomicrobia bacterium]|nr:amidohydrolase family protein [Verrucomicrobiota bacterium]
MRIAAWLAGMLGGGAALATTATAAGPLVPPGFSPVPPGVHALVGARVFTQPDTSFTNATVVIRDGRIAAIGPEVTPPADARVWDMTGRIIYPGFLDPYLVLEEKARPVSQRLGAGRDSNAGGRSARAADAGTGAGGYPFFGVPDPGTGAGPGYAVAGITPQRRMAAEYQPDRKVLEGLRELGFTAGNVTPGKGILRGQSALVLLGDGSANESLLTGRNGGGTAEHWAFEVPSVEGAFPDSLMGVLAAIRQAQWDAEWWSATQAAFVRDPLRNPRPAANEALKALAAPRETPAVVVEPGSVLMADRAHRILAECGRSNAVLVASGGEWRRPDLLADRWTACIVPLDFPALPKLPSEEAWESVSLDALRAWDWAPSNPSLIARSGTPVALTLFGLADRKDFRRNLRAALDRGLTETEALAGLTTVPARLCGMEGLLGTLAPGRLANLTITDSRGYLDPEGEVVAVWIEGRPFDVAPPAKVSASEQKTATPETAKSDPVKEAGSDKGQEKNAARRKEGDAREMARKRVARNPQTDRGPITNPPSVLVRGATLWTCGPEGVLTNASLWIEGGRLRAVGAQVPEPHADTLVVDGSGLHVTPGLVDCHSHSAILGGVNESSLPSTAMVRIGDVVNSETPNLHRQLAGGLTVANLLHGSANPIGGQNQVIKLREGAAPEDLKFTNAPQGIKFALGENVKQANWGERFHTRFPQTRMGVPAFHQNRFTAARQYAAAWRDWEAVKSRDPGTPPPRRDLELEAIAEILAGTRLIHCHSYRQDEIVVFLRVMESFGVRVATLQHVLEGYKVADEIARHGAGGSAFSDWWAYKFEVYDAIPYAGSLMRERGVNVSFNSDDDDLARRLNLEAAKAVKYGGTPEVEALKFVTLNPARQLGIDRWVGSLEPGKDADFAVWSGPPLDSSSRCLETWIEGRRYFDRAQAAQRAAAADAERQALIAKARKLQGEGADAAAGEAAREKFFRRALETAVHLGVSRCEDCQLPQRE